MPVVWRWIGAAAVAAAGIVAWISWAPGPPVPVAGPIVDRPAESNGPGIVPEPGTRIAKPAPAFRADSSRPRRRPVGREHSATPPDPAIALPGQPLPVEVTAMREIEPIAVVAVEGSNIEPDAIAVAALKPIGELEVEQLFAPTRRD